MEPDEENPSIPVNAESANPLNNQGSPVKAVFVGVVVDLGGSLLAGIALSIIYAFILAASGVPPSQITSTLETSSNDSWITMIGWAVGGVFSVLGGFCCARIAKRSEYKVSAIAATITTTLGLMIDASEYNPIMNAVLMFSSFALVLVGARFGVLANRQSS